ncbi:MAG TPA: hypothetical protein VFF65_01955 [Phycisphaerales bacterium]|nr:hypothetical protein [Phycisphaerales bacterium]
MPDTHDDLVARLDALGARAATEVPPLPGAFAGPREHDTPRLRVPLPALVAAAVVVIVGGSLVFVGVRGRRAEPDHATASTGLPDNLLTMLRRFNRAGGIDSAVSAPHTHPSAQADEPVMRPTDARAGVLQR